MVYGKGINDMPKNWTVENEWNHRIYQLWVNMLKRCYSEKWHETRPTYIDCTVCERWLTLSNFVEDIVKIDNYDYERFMTGELELDKDIKLNGKCKEYSLENCMFVNHVENVRQANATRDYTYLQGKNHPQAKLIVRYDLNMNLIDIKYQFEYVQMGFHASAISSCCKGKRKSTGGYIFKYHNK